LIEWGNEPCSVSSKLLPVVLSVSDTCVR